jgi:hypothetical protein
MSAISHALSSPGASVLPLSHPSPTKPPSYFPIWKKYHILILWGPAVPSFPFIPEPSIAENGGRRRGNIKAW